MEEKGQVPYLRRVRYSATFPYSLVFFCSHSPFPGTITTMTVMMRPLYSFLIICLSIFHIFTTASAQTVTPTITALAVFASLKPCAQGCITGENTFYPSDYIGNALGCVVQKGESILWGPESCYCRTDQQSAALSVISSCVEEYCTVGDHSIDFSSVSSMYAGYCTSEGYIPAAKAQATGKAG
jgi:hypothetical protein